MDTQLHVLLIGDSCTDVYVYGNCDRLSPEAPVPVLRETRSEQKAGMATNVKHNLEALGCIVDYITHEEAITKTRFIDARSKNQLLRVDNDVKVNPWQFDYSIDYNKYDAVVISDYNKGFLTYDNIDDVISSFDGPVFIDTKKTDLVRFEKAYVKINELEYSRRTSDCNNLIVTLGSRGASWIKLGELYPTSAIEVIDVCGAGDTFLSALAYHQTLNGNIGDAIDFANQAAAITVGHFGVYAPSLKEIVPN
jgi:bifunctional ADP-heptose synthase (sugar kinase/adenylyltransferase)